MIFETMWHPALWKRFCVWAQQLDSISPEAREAYKERENLDQRFRYSEEPQTLTCDKCGATGDAHCFGRFSFRGALPEFLCVPCIVARAEMVKQHCLNKGVPLEYEGGRDR